MTPEQFELIAWLIHASGMSREGVEMVLVDGLRQCDAARKLGVMPTLIATSLPRYREIHARIKAAYMCAECPKFADCPDAER